LQHSVSRYNGHHRCSHVRPAPPVSTYPWTQQYFKANRTHQCTLICCLQSIEAISTMKFHNRASFLTKVRFHTDKSSTTCWMLTNDRPNTMCSNRLMIVVYMCSTTMLSSLLLATQCQVVGPHLSSSRTVAMCRRSTFYYQDDCYKTEPTTTVFYMHQSVVVCKERLEWALRWVAQEAILSWYSPLLENVEQKFNCNNFLFIYASQDIWVLVGVQADLHFWTDYAFPLLLV
jgi:hypothetical protein